MESGSKEENHGRQTGEQERDENLETFGENGVLGRSISKAELREQEKRRKSRKRPSVR